MPGYKSETCYSKEVDSIFIFFSSGAPQAIRIYLPNCLYAYCWRMYWIFGGCCSSFYTDQDFPPQELNVVTMTCALPRLWMFKIPACSATCRGTVIHCTMFRHRPSSARTLAQSSMTFFVCAPSTRPEGLIPWESGWWQCQRQVWQVRRMGEPRAISQYIISFPWTGRVLPHHHKMPIDWQWMFLTSRVAQICSAILW